MQQGMPVSDRGGLHTAPAPPLSAWLCLTPALLRLPTETLRTFLSTGMRYLLANFPDTMKELARQSGALTHFTVWLPLRKEGRVWEA